MRLWEAKKMLPNLICLPSDYESYSIYSKRMFEIIRRFTPDIEEYSIDEAFADLSGLRRLYRTSYPEIAWKIKHTIQNELGINVSVGLSASKTLAKIASKETKPDGFTVVPANQLHNFLPKIELERVCGFGPNTIALLQKQGVRNAYDYINRTEIWAKQLLGKIGVELWHELRGESVYGLSLEPKENYLSIGKTKTFTPPSAEKDFVSAQLLRNLESAFIKLRRHKLRTKTILVFLRTQDFKDHGVGGDLQRHTRSTLEVMPLVLDLFEKIFHKNVLYRSTGIVLSHIECDNATQFDLFEDELQLSKYRAIDAVIDEANDKYGKHSLSIGPSLWLKKHKQHISERGDMPKRKEALLKGETFRRRIGIPMWNVKI